MFYQRSLDIERRLETTLDLIRSGEYSTAMLAEKLGVSIPTMSRHLTALRERGHDIRSERTEGGWRYILRGAAVEKKSQPRLRSVEQEIPR